MVTYALDVQPLSSQQDAIAELVKHLTDAVTERLVAFKGQVKPGQALPYFVLHPGSGEPGGCTSCGEAWGTGGRCLACKAAALMVVEELLAARLAPVSTPSSCQIREGRGERTSTVTALTARRRRHSEAGAPGHRIAMDASAGSSMSRRCCPKPTSNG
jgi:hypothetical protein